MSWVDAILDHPVVYRLWQAPFALKKFEPILRHNDITKVHKVLDVGCGPGTNAHYFITTGYLGIDLNKRYIEDARRRYRHDFVVADVINYSAECAERFDFILVNSFLHHLDEPAVIHVLSHLRRLLTEGGYIHILELVQPVRPGIAALLKRWDRGNYARPVSAWQKMFASIFDMAVFEQYELKALGATLWNMVYFKGQVK